MIAISFFFLTKSADFFITYSKAIALRLGWSPLFIGATIVAFGTSAPELFVSVLATLRGNTGIALGNIIGSNIANIGLCLGISGLITTIIVKNKIFIKKTVILATLYALLGFFLIDLTLSRIEGSIFFTILITYIIFMKNNSEIKPITNVDHKSLLLEILFFSLSLIIIITSSHYVIEFATKLAHILLVPEKVIGISLIALGTSLPELVTSVVAIIHKEYELSIGNILGSNIFNIAMILGVIGIIKPITATKSILTTDIPIMIGFLSLFAISLLIKKINKPLALLLLGSYLFYIAKLYI